MMTMILIMKITLRTGINSLFSLIKVNIYSLKLLHLLLILAPKILIISTLTSSINKMTSNYNNQTIINNIINN